MASVLLDTSVASFLHPKKRTSALRMAYDPDLRNQTLCLSFQSVGELYLWAERNRWGPTRRQELEALISRFLIIPYDRGLARVWARVMDKTRASGRRLEAGDAWIAATAIHRSIPLITHDKDLTRLNLTGLNVICHA